MRLIGLAVALAVSLVLAPCSGDAQQPPMIPRLCYLTYAPSAPHDGAFLHSLRDLGYTEGRNLIIDFLSADGRFARFPALAAECVRLKADIIVALTTPGALAAKQATSTIPIVSGLPAILSGRGPWPAWRAPAEMSRGERR
jgi:putative ABC transport system substrate-binding protein